MQTGTALAVLALGCSSLKAVETNGIRPRASRSAYSVTSFNESIAIAADLLAPEQVRRTFGVDLECCIVVEVGVYPKGGTSFGLRQSDFVLRVRASRELMRPVGAAEVAVLKSSRGHESQLGNRQLPEVMVVHPVAGYLYFTVPDPQFCRLHLRTGVQRQQRVADASAARSSEIESLSRITPFGNRTRTFAPN